MVLGESEDVYVHLHRSWDCWLLGLLGAWCLVVGREGGPWDTNLKAQPTVVSLVRYMSFSFFPSYLSPETATAYDTVSSTANPRSTYTCMSSGFCGSDWRACGSNCVLHVPKYLRPVGPRTSRPPNYNSDYS